MATFPAIQPSYGAEKKSQPKLQVISFGDGYEQRVSFGINQNPKVWSLSWVNITEANSDTIEAFLDARAADGAYFDWQPPDQATSSKWVCPEWNKSISYTGRATITATFREVFEA
jgi:phage-related protein